MIKGIVRRIDELGRVTIPVEYRKSFGVAPKEIAAALMRLSGKVVRVELKPEKAVGIVRFLDELGRLTLPVEIRRALGLEVGQEVDMYIDGGEICIAKFDQSCIICGSSEQLMEVKGIHICYGCAAKVISKFLEV